MSSLSTHVLDVSSGRPAAELPVTLQARRGDGWREVARALTNAEGRIQGFLPPGSALEAGVYRLSFDTAAYFQAQGTRGFYPVVEITFEMAGEGEHYHVPLLLSPFGFSTYRGS